MKSISVASWAMSCGMCLALLPDSGAQAASYRLAIEQVGATEWLAFRPTEPTNSSDLSTGPVEEPVDGVWTDSGDHRREAREITGAAIGRSPAQNRPQAAPFNGLGLP